MTCDEWERAVLSYAPFAGDKDDGGYRMLSDRIVTARKAGQCATCLGEIVPGTRIRRMTAVEDERTVRTARDCQECCDAMAIADEDFGDSIMARCDLGARRARERDDREQIARDEQTQPAAEAANRGE